MGEAPVNGVPYTRINAGWEPGLNYYERLGSSDALRAAFSQHAGDTSIHFEDAPGGGTTYARRSNQWVVATDYFDLKGSADAVQADLDDHKGQVNPHVTTLSSLEDTNIPVPAAEQMLIYRDSQWENTVTLGSANGVCPLDSGGKVDAQYLPSGSGLVLQGSWDAAVNSPTLPSGSEQDGHYWTVIKDGTTQLGNVTNWAIGDLAVYSDTEPGNWFKIPSANTVASVFGRTGAVVADATDYAAHYDTLGSASTVQTNLTTHTDDTTIHFADAPSGSPYVRLDNAWDMGRNHFTILPGGTNINWLQRNNVWTNADNHYTTKAGGDLTRTDLDNHTQDTSIHFADAPADNLQYARQNNTWVRVAGGGGSGGPSQIVVLDQTGTFTPTSSVISLAFASYDLLQITPTDGLVIAIRFADTGGTVLHGPGNLNLAVKAPFKPGVNDTLTLACVGSEWYETSRSKN